MSRKYHDKPRRDGSMAFDSVSSLHHGRVEAGKFFSYQDIPTCILVRLPVEAFVEFLDELVDPGVKEAVARRLVADKQLPDKSFKATATRVLGKLGGKIAGKAGEEAAGMAAPAAERIGAFLAGLLSGDANNAVGAIKPGEYTDAI